MSSKVERLDELIQICNRWDAQEAYLHSDSIWESLRELKSARESLREAVGLLTELSNDDIITASEIADLAKRSRAFLSRQGMEL
jgi:hypothetical protein